MRSFCPVGTKELWNPHARALSLSLSLNLDHDAETVEHPLL